jgi:hypothetical protein
VKYIALDRIRTVLAEHFPEWLGGTCSCGVEILTYEIWLDHIMATVETEWWDDTQHKEKDDVAQGDSML